MEKIKQTVQVVLQTNALNLTKTLTFHLVGRNLDVKLEVPRSLIVNLAKNLIVNLDVGVNLDVDVVKFFILVNIFYLYIL